ncbi:hypothetical protein AHMF7605_16385 [Adhaeribacter arboris]|uniref:MarR family transcriptional regulator n=1 Tax=Adhaeribacter arboris TaxID=2072846 RepID=A0A2T2YHM5_9BACT|nr:hypothetical protein [Adhaeribacter arboris]PSR54968.1 hypothetical protein AHMF7605_16385 [Adhaeribacter arboris]
MQAKNLPIGYWIKQADTLLTQGIDALQSSLGLTRLKWQMLHTIREKEPIHTNELTALLKPFAEKSVLETTLEALKQDSLILEKEEPLSLTAKGITLHAVCFEQQKTFRQKAMAGITEQQYEQTVATLQKIAENLSPQI